MECGTCTLCCDIFPVAWLKKPANTACTHCSGSGCLIHDSKPSECTDFNCAYAQAEKASPEVRPDKSKIIFEKISDVLMYGTLAPASGFTDTALAQIDFFIEEGFSVVIHRFKDKPKVWLAKDHTMKSVKEELNANLKARYGNA